MLKKIFILVLIFYSFNINTYTQNVVDNQLPGNLIIYNNILPELYVSEPIYKFNPLLPEKAWIEWNEIRPTQLQIINNTLPVNFFLPFEQISFVNFVVLPIIISGNSSVSEADSNSIYHNILRDDSANYGIKLDNKYNFVLVIDGVTKPANDFQSYANVYINRKKVGTTEKGLITQRKVFKTNLSVNRHLLRIKIVIQDEINKQWKQLLNTQQPRDQYFPVKEGHITLVKMTYNPDNEYNPYTFIGKFVPMNNLN